MSRYFGLAHLDYYITTLKEYEMKRSALVAILLALSLTACGEKPAEEAAESAPATEKTAPAPEAVPAPQGASTPEAASAPAAATTEAAPAEEPAASEKEDSDEPAQN